MKLLKIFICCFLITIFPILISAQHGRNANRRLTKRDKTEIVEQAFADGFEKLMKDGEFSECTIPLVYEEQIILIRTKEPAIFPKSIGEYRLMFMTEKKIESEIKSNNGDCFFDLSPLIGSGNKVKVTLWRWVQVITVLGGKSIYPNRWVAATGRVYEATRVKGIWQVKFLNSTALES